MKHQRYSKQKGTLHHTVSCRHKSAIFDGIKLSMTKLRDYIVIVPPCLLENGTGYHICQALFLNNIILRIIKKADPVINYEVKNISIDDFSHCKRKIYFSILVDNDTGKRLEVVPSRYKENFRKLFLCQSFFPAKYL